MKKPVWSIMPNNAIKLPKVQNYLAPPQNWAKVEYAILNSRQ